MFNESQVYALHFFFAKNVKNMKVFGKSQENKIKEKCISMQNNNKFEKKKKNIKSAT